MKISTVTITRFTDQYMIINLLRSLVDLSPDECVVLDTTIDKKRAEENQGWLKSIGQKLGLKMVVGYREWVNNYSYAKNTALDMCGGDWVFFLDSDEMVTKEVARDLRTKILSLPPKVKMLRIQRLNLLDDSHAYRDSSWRGKPSIGFHPHIFKRGVGHYEGLVHERFIYPERDVIALDSPSHPARDWRDYYNIHLWFYKDNPLRRWPDDINEVSGDDIWRKNQDNLLKLRRWERFAFPKDIASWVNIEWKPIDLVKLRKERKGKSGFKHVPFNHRLREYVEKNN